MSAIISIRAACVVQCDEQMEVSCLRQRPTHETYTVKFSDADTSLVHLSLHEAADESGEGAGTAQQGPCGPASDHGTQPQVTQRPEAYPDIASVGRSHLRDSSSIVVDGISESSVRTESSNWGSREVQQQLHSAGPQFTTGYDIYHRSRSSDYPRWPFTPSKPVDVPKPPFHFNMSEAALIADPVSYTHLTLPTKA